MLIASYKWYWQIHPPQKWVIYGHLCFSVLCHSIPRHLEPGRGVRMPSLLLVLSRSRAQLAERLCTAPVLSAPCKEITSDSVWDNSLSARRDFWWSLEVAKTHSTVMVRRRGGGKKSSLGKKLQRVKFLTLHWALHLLLGFFCHTRSLLQCHCGHSHTILSSCRFLHIQNCSQNPQSPFCDQSGTYFTMVALLMSVRHGNLHSQKSKKALQKSCINSPSHVFSSHALSTPHFHGVSSALISREGVSQQT